MNAIDPADLYALLEDGPHPLAELAGWLERSVDDVRQALTAASLKVCERCDRAFVPSRGGAGRYCTRGCYQHAGPGTRAITRNGGRTPWVDHQARHGAILQVLKDKRPRLIAELAGPTGLTVEQLQLECRALRVAGQLRLVFIGAAKHWTIAETAAPSIAEIADDEIAAADADLAEELEDVDVDEDIEELPLPRVKGQRPRSTDAGGAPLRQAKPTVAADPAWWIGLSRDEFTAEAARRAKAMREAKENGHVRLRILQ